MYEKEINLEKVLNLVWAEELSLYSFLNDEQSEINYENRLNECRDILNNGGKIFVGIGIITDGREIGEFGNFYIESRNCDEVISLHPDESYYEDELEGKPYDTGEFGVFIKKIGDKYYAEYAIYDITPGVVCFVGYTIDFHELGEIDSDDKIGLFIKKYLDNLEMI